MVQVISEALSSSVAERFSPNASPASPAYLVVDWVSQSAGHAPEFPARVHLYDLGPDGFAIAGLERPETFEPPAQ